MGYRVIFFTESQNGACARYRAYLPAQALNEAGWYCRTSVEWQPKMLDEFDIFVFQRINQKEGVILIDELNKVGKYTIYDIDDDLLHIPASSPVQQLMLEHLDMIGAQMLAISKCRAVTVTTDKLKESLMGITPNTYVLPNLVRAQSWVDLEPLRYQSDKYSVVLGWAGSNTHKDALELLEEPLNIIIDRYPQVFVVMMGDALPFKFPVSRHVVVPWGKYRLFQSVLLGWDIGLAPLGPTTFNQSKSNLRLLELGMAGKCAIASDWGEYTKLIDPGQTGWLCRDTHDWIEHLSMMIEDRTARETMGRNLRQAISPWELYNGIGARINLYNKFAEEQGYRAN